MVKFVFAVILKEHPYIETEQYPLFITEELFQKIQGIQKFIKLDLDHNISAMVSIRIESRTNVRN